MSHLTYKQHKSLHLQAIRIIGPYSQWISVNKLSLTWTLFTIAVVIYFICIKGKAYLKQCWGRNKSCIPFNWKGREAATPWEYQNQSGSKENVSIATVLMYGAIFLVIIWGFIVVESRSYYFSSSLFSFSFISHWTHIHKIQKHVLIYICST